MRRLRGRTFLGAALLLLAGLGVGTPLRAGPATQCDPVKATITFQADDDFFFYLNGIEIVNSVVPNGSNAEAVPITTTIPISDFAPAGQSNYFSLENQNSTCQYIGSDWLITVQCADGTDYYMSDADTALIMYDDVSGANPPPAAGGYQWYQPGYTNPTLFNMTPTYTNNFWWSSTPIINPSTGNPVPTVSHSATGEEGSPCVGAGDGADGTNTEALYYIESVVLEKYSPTPSDTPTDTRTV
ncbi:MAG: hypothetical protein ACREKE_02865, partial [bacterium]